MGLEILTLGSSKTYTNMVALGLASATIDDVNKSITFTLASDGSQHTIHFNQPSDGQDGISITGVNDLGNGTFTLLLSDGSESEPIHTVKGDPFTYSDFTAEQLESLRGEKGYSPTITENADNTDKIYKLDIETVDGKFTTPNLKCADGQGGSGGTIDAPINSISVNGVNVLPDENKNVDITVPEAYDDTELLDIRVKADGTTATSAGNAVREQFNEIKGDLDELKQKIEPEENDIPKVFFDEAIPQTKTDTVSKFRYVSKTKDIEGYVQFKAQGNSSMSYPKKNQTVKMYKDEALTEKIKIDFKGWGKQNKHVYKANWIDLTHSRNIVSARLWGQLVKTRSAYNELPKLYRTSPNQGAVDGFPIKVYSQGIYQGRYTLNIPKDKWMANMDDSLDAHCILCGENYVSGCFRATANIDGTDWTDEVHDVVPESIKTRWNEIISFVMNSADEEFKANLSNYFYIDSLIDKLIFGVVACDLDGFGKNQIYYTYDGQKWIAGKYDMDSTFGLWWNGSSFVASDYARESFQDFKDGQGNLLYIRLAQLFYEEVQTRWNEVKDTVLSAANIINEFEKFTDIASNDLVKEDYARTTANGKFTGIPSQSTNNIQQIRKYIVDRRSYCETYFESLTPEVEVPCTGITLSSDTITFTEAGTQTLTATVTPDGCTDEITWESDNTSIATVEGGVVTAIANGECNITAKCGEHSAVCSVAISGLAEHVPCTGITIDVESLTFTSLDGGAQTVTATVTPSDTTDRVVWASNDTTVATVNGGVVTPIGYGDCIITATCGNQSANCAVSVSSVGVYTLTIDTVGLYKSTGLDSTITRWRTSEIMGLPSDITTGTISIKSIGNNNGQNQAIIDTFDADGKFIQEYAGNYNTLSVAFDSSVKYYAVAAFIGVVAPANPVLSVVIEPTAE